MKNKSLTEITFNYKGKEQKEYFKDVSKFEMFYPGAEIIKNRYISAVTQEKELEGVYKNHFIFE